MITIENIEQGLKENILYHIERYNEGERDIEDIVGVCKKLDEFKSNVGISVSRIETNDREKAFHDQWLIENEPRPGINFGHGILQDLFIKSNGIGVMDQVNVLEVMSPRDRMIVATIIQWLGSNVGMCFLSESLKRFGATITYK